MISVDSRERSHPPGSIMEKIEIVSIRHIPTYALDDYEIVARINGEIRTYICGGDYTTFNGKGIAWADHQNPSMSEFVRKQLNKAFCDWKGWT